MAEKEIIHAQIWKGKIGDITTFKKLGKPKQLAGGKKESPRDTIYIDGKLDKTKRQAEECQGEVIAPNKRKARMSGRILACPCFKREYASITVRGDAPEDEKLSIPVYDPIPAIYIRADFRKRKKLRDKKLRALASSSPELNGICQEYRRKMAKCIRKNRRKEWNGCTYKPTPREPQKQYPAPFLCLFDDVCQVLMEKLPIESGKELTGALIITGTTGSGKSQIARGLIYYYLTSLLRGITTGSRRPHLLTIENPIEKFLFEDCDHKYIPPEIIQALYGIDYTPRQLGTNPDSDVSSLREALMQDALRQKPAVVYVGEVRDKVEWRAVMDFAGTGHFVVATAHAGSVVETMEKIMDATRAETPAERGQIAQRIHAIIHLTSLNVDVRGPATEEDNFVEKTLIKQPSGSELLCQYLNNQAGSSPLAVYIRDGKTFGDDEGVIKRLNDLLGNMELCSSERFPDSCLQEEAKSRIERHAELKKRHEEFQKSIRGSKKDPYDPIELKRFNRLLLEDALAKFLKPSLETRQAGVPALWLGTPAGIAALVADGLASILPNDPGDPPDPNDPRQNNEYYSIGRKWFLKQLLKKAHYATNSHSLTKAMNSDLQGM